MCIKVCVQFTVFASVMDSLTDHLNNDIREFLYVDDLAILGNSWENVGQGCAGWGILWKAEI